MLTVEDVDYLEEYKLLLTFSDGVTKLVDLEPYLKGNPKLVQLRDKHEFIQFALTTLTLEWRNGVDFAPEFLYEIGTAA